MEELYEKGLCKAIGVCNCNVHHLQELAENSRIVPMVNQFECPPLFTQNPLREYCQKNGIQVMAYMSTAWMDERLFKTVLALIANKYHKSVAQVILRWHQQIGNVPIINSFNSKHIKKNADIYDFKLSEKEVDSIFRN